MSSRPPERGDFKTTSHNFGVVTWLLPAVALIYALLAGLHTVQDFDLGWQLASGRWMVQHGQIFSTDVFSYTAHGAPWIYPALSGIVFYLVYLSGGYALLSWMGAAASAGTIALLLRHHKMASCALALVAVPLVASRTQPRAEMFTTILFAAFLSLLWRHYSGGHEKNARPDPLWLLPVLMVLWVNLHPGFVAGLALCGAYLLLEVLDLLLKENCAAVHARLRRAWPWLLATVAATLANPWGISIYRALGRQQQAQSVHNQWVVEWEGIHPSWSSLRQAIDLRDPQSGFWWLLAIGLVCAVIALWRKRWGAAVLLLASAYFALRHVRLQVLFTCVTAVVGGSLLSDAWVRLSAPRRPAKTRKNKRAKLAQVQSFPWTPAAILLLVAALTSVAGVRCWDLLSNRYYLASTQLSLFGTGISWWFPERALDFIEREKLPANIFNSYSLGGYLTWRLFPDYQDYIDSRALPFGTELFFRAYDLMSAESPESRAWQEEAESRNINTIVVPLARYDGIALFPQLRPFCIGEKWRPVYIDEVSAVFVRRTPQTAALTDRLQIDCDKVAFTPPAELQSGAGSSHWNSRSRTELFNFWANAAEILYTLGRYPEALAALDRAQSIFRDSANLHLIRGLVLQRTGHSAEAEAELRASLNLEPSEQALLVLGLLYMTQNRSAEAVDLFRRSAESSGHPHDTWMLLGQAYLQMHQPEAALDAFEKADVSSPFHGEALGARFNSMVATGRAKAWYQLGDLARAVSYQQDAVRFAPNDSKLWQGLADLYEAQGRAAEAEEARSRAAEMKSQQK